MKKLLLLPLALVALVATVASFGAIAQTAAPGNDAAYCAALVDKYEKYLGRNGGRGRATSDITADVAVAKCNAGDTASGIPVLESRLRDSKITLPPRG